MSSFPSLVCMTEVPRSFSLDDILAEIRKYGHNPIKGAIKESKGRTTCLIQFADLDAAAEAVSQLNGKPISFSAYGFHAKTTFHLTQCTDSNFKLHIAWVGNLAPEVNDNEFFEFFGSRFNNLFDAKVTIDSNGNSRGFGYLAFSTEEDQLFCIKFMDGSLEWGNRMIRMKPVAAEATVKNCPAGISPKVAIRDAWSRYMGWNQYIEPAEYSFIAVKSKLISCKDNKRDNEVETSTEDLSVVDFDVTSYIDYADEEMFEKDYNLWDALECSKWLPFMALKIPINAFVFSEEFKAKQKKPGDVKMLPKTNVSELKANNSLDANISDKLVVNPKEKSPTKVPNLRESEDIAKKPLDIIHLHVIGPLTSSQTDVKKRYIVVFVDEYSKLGVDYVVKNMTELGQKFESFLKNGRKQLGYKAQVRYLYVSDVNNITGGYLKIVLNREEIRLQQTPSNVPQLATKVATVLLRKVKSLMLDSKLPKRLWSLSMAMAVYVYNRTPLESLDYETPSERFSSEVQERPYYFTRFGCVAYTKLPLNRQTNGEREVPSPSLSNGILENVENLNDENDASQKNKIVRYFFVGYRCSSYLLFHPESNTFIQAGQVWCNEKIVFGDVYSKTPVEKDIECLKHLTMEKQSTNTNLQDFGPSPKRLKTDSLV